MSLSIGSSGLRIPKEAMDKINAGDLSSFTASAVGLKRASPTEASQSIAHSQAVMKASQTAISEADQRAANWGYLAQLNVEGGQANIDSFQTNLVAYLKTTKIWPSSLDVKT